MTNIELLKKLINSDEISETIEALANEIEAKNDRIKELEDEIKEMKDNTEEETTDYEFLGLDTIHYRLEDGNLKIRLQLEDFFQKIKKQNCAGELIPE